MTITHDFVDLFTHQRQGHIGKYVYEYRPEIYNQILCQDSYYPFATESYLLKKHSAILAQQIGKVDYVLELGPGSKRPIQHKTIPLLTEILKENLNLTYGALDHSKFYADQACQIVKEAIPTLKTKGYNIDFSNESSFSEINRLTGCTLFICFGQPIFANHDINSAKNILRNISNAMNHGDCLLMGIDFTRDINKIEAAYNTELGAQLLFNAFYFFQETQKPTGFNANLFEHNYNWNSDLTRVELSLVATQPQKFKINTMLIEIEAGQKFTLMYSCKPNLSTVLTAANEQSLFQDPENIDLIREGDYLFLLLKKA
jgi:uncharacterized SAM-dependent methyltransferase